MPKHKSVQILILLFCLGDVLFPQQKTWNRISGTEGSYIESIDIYSRNTDTVYAFGDWLFRSTDAGSSWIIIDSTSGDGIGVDPTDSKILYGEFTGGGDGSIDMSTDGGLNWSHVTTGRAGTNGIIEIDRHDHNIVYVGVAPGYFINTTDRGTTWTGITSLGHVGPTSLVIDPSNDSILYVGSLTGIYKSSDRGQNWIQLNVGISFSLPTYLAINPKDRKTIYAAIYSFGGTNGGIYKTIDGGIHWAESNNGLSSDDWRLNGIAINPKNPEELYIGGGTPRLLFKSTNGGNSWYEYTNGLPDSGHVRAIAIDTVHDRIFIGVNTPQAAGIYVCNCTTPVDTTKVNLPHGFLLLQNFPNPFNPLTNIKYEIPKTCHAILKVYDIIGKEVVTLVDEVKLPGRYQVNWIPQNLSSGIYLCRLTAGDFIEERKMILVK